MNTTAPYSLGWQKFAVNVNDINCVLLFIFFFCAGIHSRMKKKEIWTWKLIIVIITALLYILFSYNRHAISAAAALFSCHLLAHFLSLIRIEQQVRGGIKINACRWQVFACAQLPPKTPTTTTMKEMIMKKCTQRAIVCCTKKRWRTYLINYSYKQPAIYHLG